MCRTASPGCARCRLRESGLRQAPTGTASRKPAPSVLGRRRMDDQFAAPVVESKPSPASDSPERLWAFFAAAQEKSKATRSRADARRRRAALRLVGRQHALAAYAPHLQ